QPVLPQQVFGLLIILQQFVQYFIGNSHSFLSSQLSLATYTIIFTAPQRHLRSSVKAGKMGLQSADC
ncbi:MAG TPA: hypothetical protein VGY98_15275, partial [Verrucomicrobiae bacterium]|nr:hypothetical protein [Verrucomicrobiae bacterium]